MNVDAVTRLTDFATHAFARAAAPRIADAVQDAGTQYTVQPGDSFYGIAEAHLRHSGIANPTYAQIVAYSEQIAAANGVTTASLLLPGDSLTLPPIPQPAGQAPAPATPAPQEPATAADIVDVSDGIDTTEAALVVEENFDAIDADDNGSLSYDEIAAYAANVDPDSIEGRVAIALRDSRGVDGGLFQELGYGARSGEYSDAHISAKDVANVLATSDMPPGLDAAGQAAFINSQLNAINRAVAEDGYDQGDAAELVEMVLSRNADALADPAVAAGVDLDALAASAQVLAEGSDDPASLTAMNGLLAAGVERSHAANNDTAANGAIAAMGQLFDRYLEVVAGDDPAKIEAAASQFVADSGLERLELSPYTVGVVYGALVSGGLSRVDAITDDANARQGLLRSIFTGVAGGLAIAAALPTAGASTILWATAGSVAFGALADRVPDADSYEGMLYALEGQFRQAFEELDGVAGWTLQDIDDATRGMETAINLGGHPS